MENYVARTPQQATITVPRFVTISEAAKITHISQYTLREWNRKGLLPAIDVGTKTLVNVELLVEQLENYCRGKLQNWDKEV